MWGGGAARTVTLKHVKSMKEKVTRKVRRKVCCVRKKVLMGYGQRGCSKERGPGKKGVITRRFATVGKRGMPVIIHLFKEGR